MELRAGAIVGGGVLGVEHDPRCDRDLAPALRVVPGHRRRRVEAPVVAPKIDGAARVIAASRRDDCVGCLPEKCARIPVELDRYESRIAQVDPVAAAVDPAVVRSRQAGRQIRPPERDHGRYGVAPAQHGRLEGKGGSSKIEHDVKVEIDPRLAAQYSTADVAGLIPDGVGDGKAGLGRDGQEHVAARPRQIMARRALRPERRRGRETKGARERRAPHRPNTSQNVPNASAVSFLTIAVLSSLRVSVEEAKAAKRAKHLAACTLRRHLAS